MNRKRTRTPATTMLAARWHGVGDLRSIHEPIPVPTSDQALVEVSYTGLCGSDREEFEAGPVVAAPGVILGHEIVGRVVATAVDGSGPEIGTAVVVDVVVGCQSCYWCLRHEEGRCPDLTVIGQTVDGGLAQYVAARADRLVPVPDSLPLRAAALAEPLAVAVRGVRRLGGVAGGHVLVYGGGTIGILTAWVVRAVGGIPLAVEPDPVRRALLRTSGVLALWAPTEAERSEQIAAVVPRHGPLAVVECTGVTGVAAEACRRAGAGATIVLLGVPTEPQTIDVLDVVLREKRVVGSAAHMWDDDVAVAVSLLTRGVVDAELLITHEVPLSDVERAFRLLGEAVAAPLKVLVDCRI